MVCARGRPLEGGGERSLADTLPRQWAPALNHGISTHALPSVRGQYSRFVRDLTSRELVVFGRWCVEEAG